MKRAFLFLAATFLAVMIAGMGTAKGKGKKPPPRLTVKQLKNAVYKDWTFEGKGFRLRHGAYQKGTTPSDGYIRWTYEGAAFGDLDGDGAEDAIVMLAENSGGSGNFYWLVAMANRGGKPTCVAVSDTLGDRIILRKLRIAGRSMVVDAVTQDETDGLCCPTRLVTWTLRMKGSKLIVVSEKKGAHRPYR